ncbi:MAG: helix-turn-helix domain-containing protein [Sphingomonadaceae bacterium]|nr:helix-turn-helix domain-containing protein [Sphingomonadaceae bacterium]
MGQFEPSRLVSDPAERARFVDRLAASGSVREAARESGVSVSTVNRLRARDRAFGDACAKVVGAPVAHALEAALIDRAINGVERRKTFANGTVETWTDYDNDLGFRLLTKLMPDQYGEGGATPAVSRTIERAEFLAIIRARVPLPVPAETCGRETPPLQGHTVAEIACG